MLADPFSCLYSVVGAVVLISFVFLTTFCTYTPNAPLSVITLVSYHPHYLYFTSFDLIVHSFLGAVVLIALRFLTPFCKYIPKAALSAVIISACIPTIDYEIVKKIWKVKSKCPNKSAIEQSNYSLHINASRTWTSSAHVRLKI